MSSSESPKLQTLGVDFSTDPANISCCLIDWAGEQPRIAEEAFGLRRADPCDDLRDRIDSIGAGGKVGLDVPLGWPKTFVSSVSEHARSGQWTCSRDACLWRTTDNRVKEVKGPKGERGRPPLSVTANLIAATQSFPDFFDFGDRRRGEYQQLIGNAVPPKLAYAVLLHQLA